MKLKPPLSEGKPPFSYGFPLVFLWFSYGLRQLPEKMSVKFSLVVVQLRVVHVQLRGHGLLCWRKKPAEVGGIPTHLICG
jgi:hypothetical protein